MEVRNPVDISLPSEMLVRLLRRGTSGEVDVMPESVAWQLYVELRRRGEPRAQQLFIGALKALHSRRVMNGVHLPSEDVYPDEHRLADDAYLADLWKAYKKCIRLQRTGPASQLLQDIEEQIAH